MNVLERYKTEYKALWNGAKFLHNSLYAVTIALSLYPIWVYDSYYRNYVKARVIQKLTLPREINAEWMLWLAAVSAASMPSNSVSWLRVSIPIQELCDDIICQVWVALCTSSKDNFNICAQVMIKSISQ